MKMHQLTLFCILPLLLGFVSDAAAQSGHGFQFVRIQYGDEAAGWGSRFGDTWRHDYPTAEYNFYEALDRTTKVRITGPPVVLKLDDARIFDYPILYLCEPGYWELTDAEAENLAAYLARGGFMLFDDFRDRSEMLNLEQQMSRVLPGQSFVEVPASHPIWTIYYDVDPTSTPSLVSGRGWGGYEPSYQGLFDANGRLVAMAAHNQDLGDGWEWPDRNFDDASTVSFQMGVNFLIYALTH